MRTSNVPFSSAFQVTVVPALVRSGITETTVTVGGVVSPGPALQATVLSVLVEALLGLPAASWATLAGMSAMTVPSAEQGTSTL